jgi:hypothetical protein
MRVVSIINNAYVGNVLRVKKAEAIRLREIGWGQDLLRWTAGDHVSAHQEDMVGSFSLFKVVRGEHDGASPSRLSVNDVVDGLRRIDIKPGQGLVHQKDTVLLSEGLCNKNPLSLSPRQPKYLTLGQIVNAQ